MVKTKVLDLDALAAKTRALRAAGKKVVHCHGVFDLLHIGHIRHLREAKAMGDALVVTLTPDQWVNKGPHRPAFPEALRLEAVAALDMVDFVALNRWPQAVKAIELLRPTYYVKGPDYKDAAKDVTGGISKEEAAVRRAGGEIRFTEDVTFSSTTLLNRHVSMFEPEVAKYLERLRRTRSIDAVRGALAKLEPLRALVIGETILDEYVFCDQLGKSSKDPILAMLYASKERHVGGAAMISNHLAEFCKSVTFLSYVGERSRHEEDIRRHLKPNVRARFVIKPDSPTIVKRRFVERYLLAKQLEIYEMNDDPLPTLQDRQLVELIRRELPRHDLVVVADYGHGLLSPAAVRLLTSEAPFLAINTQLNAANRGFHTVSKYRRADYVCIQEGELRLEYRNRFGDLRGIIRSLAADLKPRAAMVTRGKYGSLLYDRKQGFFESPALASKVVDRIGAGDAVLALTSLCVASGAPPELTALLGNLAGSQAVMIVGNRASLSKASIYKGAESLLK